MCGHRYSSLTFVRRADRRGTSERSSGEGRYWREGESLPALLYCQDYFFKSPIFSQGLALGLRLTFAYFLWLFSGLPANSQPLVPVSHNHHNPCSPFSVRSSALCSQSVNVRNFFFHIGAPSRPSAFFPSS